MKNKSMIALSALTMAAAAYVAPVAHADQALATSKGCMACHQVENKVVGPALKDVAAKYKGDDSAVETLSAKVKAGGVGVWGQIPMPPQTTASEEEIKTIVSWMLSL